MEPIAFCDKTLPPRGTKAHSVRFVMNGARSKQGEKDRSGFPEKHSECVVPCNHRTTTPRNKIHSLETVCVREIRHHTPTARGAAATKNTTGAVSRVKREIVERAPLSLSVTASSRRCGAFLLKILSHIESLQIRYLNSPEVLADAAIVVCCTLRR